jgi:hypothetical protein
VLDAIEVFFAARAESGALTRSMEPQDLVLTSSAMCCD